MSSVLEGVRGSHERLERIESATVQGLMKEPRTHKEMLRQSHWVKTMLEQLENERSLLEQNYTAGSEAAEARKKEAEKLAEGCGPAGQPTPALFSNFYDRLREVKEYHRKFPNLPVQRPEEEVQIDARTITLPEFTGEELGGRSLDLHRFYTVYCNLPGSLCKRNADGNPIDYISYLRTFGKFDDTFNGKGQEYRDYLESVIAYMSDYYSKILPLNSLEDELESADAQFEDEWAKGDFSWSKYNTEEGDNTEMKDSLFCDVCAKKFAKQTVFDAHLIGKKHKTLLSKGQKRIEAHKEVSKIEWRLRKLCDLLKDQLRITRLNVEKKMARSWEETVADLEAQEEEDAEIMDEGSDSEDEEEEDIRIGIKDYPVGWDGKPIPYWLYKLHGLGVEYKCEICGNATYKGRRAYERHFQEWRHAYGMKCLGIPNTKHFQDVTKIADAIELWKKIQMDSKDDVWNASEMEEYEDAEGNVVKKKVYEDLKRQGLWDDGSNK